MEWSLRGHCSGSFFFMYFLLDYFPVFVLVSLAFVLVLVSMLSSIYVKCKYSISE